MKLHFSLKLTSIFLAAALAVGCGNSSQDQTTQPAQSAAPVVVPAAVYTLTNDADTNAIREYRRNTNGTLSFVADYPTGGSGSGDGLSGSSNALVFDPGSNRFYAVNAGSNSVTVMSLATDGTLSTVTTVNSGGTRPISVTAFADIVYVLNSGDPANNIAANISGFRLADSQLTPIEGSIEALSAANPNPAQIEFAPAGTVLAVTERATNKISTFRLDSNGAAEPVQAQDSNSPTPFGFDFTPGGVLVVSEAKSGEAAASSVSSYTLDTNGKITTISNSVANNQTGACWVQVNRFAPYAYVTNTGDDNISLYEVDASGAIGLIGSDTATGDAPVDLAISNDALYLYTLNTGDDSISAFSISGDGALTPITGVNGLPANSVGLVAR